MSEANENGGANENGKRERQAEEVTGDSPPTKSYKDGVDEVASHEGDKPSTEDSTNSESQEKGPDAPIEATPEEAKVEENTDPASEPKEASVEATNPGEAAPVEADEKTNPAGVTEGEVPFVVDREGDTEQPEKDDNTQPTGPPAAATHAPVAGLTGGAPTHADPRRAAQTAPAMGVDPTVQATVFNPDQIVEERGEIPALYVGKVIGKVRNGSFVVLRRTSFFVLLTAIRCILMQGGEMIRDLQARSGARIDVDQNVPPGSPRGITYRGTRKTVDFAKHLVAMLQQETVNENDLPLGDAKRRFVIIPAMTVGKVIGRGGEMIRELQTKSQAKIQIDHAGTSGIPAEMKQVSITGTEQAVTKAEEMINFLAANPLIEGLQAINMLVEEKLRGGQWGSGPPYPGLPTQGVNMQPEGMGAQYGGYGGGGHGGGHGGGGYQQPPSYGGPAPGGYHGAPPAQAAAPYGGGQEVDVIYVQKQYMGRIIGKKGVTINDLQRRTSCDIQVNQEVPHGSECEITMRGARQGIETAKQMIREVIEVGPQHPVGLRMRQ
jgi:rRNA processing protein Krr1/Pno1